MSLNIKISGFYDEISGDLNEQIKVLKELGETYMCPRVIDGKNIADYTAEEFIKNIKPRLDAEGIKFSSIGSPIGKIGVNDDVAFAAQKQKLKELIKIAQAMDCRYIRVFSFFIKKGEDPAQYRDVVIHKMSEFAALCNGTGIVLLHENEKGIFGATPEYALDIYKSVNNVNLELLYDASNYIQCRVDPLAAFDLLKDYTAYYHIKDCDWSTRVEMPLGTGDGQYNKILKELSERNYDGFFTLEPHTGKYAVLRKIVYFVPFLALFMSNFFKAFRKIDKVLGKKVTDSVTRKEMFITQYSNLIKMIGDISE